MSYLVNPYMVSPSGSAIMWEELARESYSGAGTDSLSVASLTDMPYYMILYHAIPSGKISVNARINGISATDYSNRTAYNGGASATTGDDRIMFPSGTSEAYDGFGVGYLQNFSADEKLFMGSTNTRMQTSASYAPSSYITIGKWADTSNAVDEIEIINTGAGDFGANSELIVLGADPSSSTTTGGFWEELETLTVGSATDSVTTSAFTAKKYLWIICNVKIATAYYHLRGQFNGITTSTYCNKGSENGASWGDETSQSRISLNAGSYASDMISFFVVNHADYEKLVIGEESGLAEDNNAGKKPNKWQFVGKWINTGTQVTSFTLFNSDTSTSNAIDAGSKITVWGSD